MAGAARSESPPSDLAAAADVGQHLEQHRGSRGGRRAGRLLPALRAGPCARVDSTLAICRTQPPAANAQRAARSVSAQRRPDGAPRQSIAPLPTLAAAGWPTAAVVAETSDGAGRVGFQPRHLLYPILPIFLTAVLGTQSPRLALRRAPPSYRPAYVWPLQLAARVIDRMTGWRGGLLNVAGELERLLRLGADLDGLVLAGTPEYWPMNLPRMLV